MSATTPLLRIVVLGASGATGQHLVDGALARGHEVHAIVRDAARYSHSTSARLTVHTGDVHDAASIAAAITPASIVLSGLGLRSKKQAGTLTAGARAVLAARPHHVVWLGAIGTGRSATAVGRLTHRLLKAGFGAEYDDKTTADCLILDAQHTVIHSGPLNDRPAPHYEALPLSSVRRRFFPAFTPRQAVAQVMLDEAEKGPHSASLLVPQKTDRTH
ncbi:NAD(P)-dependent oxidoreductase [Subtercola vilae]|uniref:NAD(P)-dependent oxidoreductase n=1 Tax=Subtercola vilae TaxID=2056433 RepID=A0A4T2C4N2_9MICO|nr:NAD(P)-binding oxidoreductase [Subtercola vilae]TIH39030.1 NAD(P)-dependent oxidoreductase [Subtercola vilae]